jgi:hypothetical protein
MIHGKNEGGKLVDGTGMEEASRRMIDISSEVRQNSSG